MDEGLSSSSASDSRRSDSVSPAEEGGKKKKINGAVHPYVPKSPKPPVGKNANGTWGPTGLYGGRVKETVILDRLRSVIKPSRLKRVEEVLTGRCKRVQCLFENLHDPANGSACLRTMEAFGVLEAHAVESYEPFKVSGGITMNADKVCDTRLANVGMVLTPFLSRFCGCVVDGC